MRSTEVIYLISHTVNVDELGNQIEVPTERKVYANKNSISANETYNAAVNGMKPEKRFEIHSFEYNDERFAKHNGILYSVIAVSERGGKTIITLERVIANG